MKKEYSPFSYLACAVTLFILSLTVFISFFIHGAGIFGFVLFLIFQIIIVPYWIKYKMLKSNEAESQKLSERFSVENSVNKANKRNTENYSTYQENYVRYKDPIYVISRNQQIQSIWSCWTLQQHDDKNQYFRRKRAFETNPIMIDSEQHAGKFLSSDEEIYDTNLTRCDCQDFQRRSLPCKHMYRLFYDIENGNELGVEDGLVRAKIILAIRRLSDYQSEAFYILLGKLKHQGVAVSKLTPTVKELISSGLLCVDDSAEKDYHALLSAMTKDEILLSLVKAKVVDAKASWTKAKLINWIVETQQDFLKKFFSKNVTITLSPDYIKASPYIHV